MESRPQNPEFRNNPGNFHPCIYEISTGSNVFPIILSCHILQMNE